MYPKNQHGTLIEVHFGSKLGHNVEVYMQHETRASALGRGKTIINNIFSHFVDIKNTSNVMGDSSNTFQQKITGYNVTLQPDKKSVHFSYKN